ncbi:MAG: CoA pyrophosphatase [Acidobacteria bacterium]|nr:MAG: CoA pyrophosphatase [Acidobacteriota bacterium]
MTVEDVVRALAGRLPPGAGSAGAHLHMAPSPRPGWKPGCVPPSARPAAGVVLVYPRGARAHVLLTLRTGRVRFHRGQVSLPGGAVDPGEKLLDAALREMEEEVGVPRDRVRVLGPLSPLHIPVSRFALHPFVAVHPEEPTFVARPTEVARLLEVPLQVLADPTTRRRESRRIGGRMFEVPFFAVCGEKIWGATAMVLAEFLALLDPGRSGG